MNYVENYGLLLWVLFLKDIVIVCESIIVFLVVLNLEVDLNFFNEWKICRLFRYIFLLERMVKCIMIYRFIKDILIKT